MDYKEDTACSIRSVLITLKNVVPLSSFENDYLEITGDEIPYRFWGFQNLKSFLETIPMVSIENHNGQLVAVSNSSATAHIAKLIAKQNTKSKSRKRKHGSNGKPQQTNNFNQATSVSVYPLENRGKTSGTSNLISASNSVKKNVTYYPPASQKQTNASSSTNDPERTVNHIPEKRIYCETKNNYFTESNSCNNKWVEELQILAEEKCWPKPHYTTYYDMMRRSHFAKLCLGDLKFKSNPTVAKTRGQAKTVVAQVALNSLRSYKLDVSENWFIKKRIKDIVFDNKDGIVSSKIEKLYIDKYKESLPKNWLSLIEKPSEIIQKQYTVLFANK